MRRPRFYKPIDGHERMQATLSGFSTETVSVRKMKRLFQRLVCRKTTKSRFYYPPLLDSITYSPVSETMFASVPYLTLKEPK
jgi:hypothetical protein